MHIYGNLIPFDSTEEASRYKSLGHVHVRTGFKRV